MCIVLSSVLAADFAPSRMWSSNRRAQRCGPFRDPPAGRHDPLAAPTDAVSGRPRPSFRRPQRTDSHHAAHPRKYSRTWRHAPTARSRASPSRFLSTATPLPCPSETLFSDAPTASFCAGSCRFRQCTHRPGPPFGRLLPKGLAGSHPPHNRRENSFANDSTARSRKTSWTREVFLGWAGAPVGQ